MLSAFNLASHLIPLVITVLVIGAIIVSRFFRPDLHYIHLVANACDEIGIEVLARYLAHKTGSKRIYTDQTWKSFIPAATKLRAEYLSKKR